LARLLERFAPSHCIYISISDLPQAKTKKVNYVESDNEADDDVFKPGPRNRHARSIKRRKVSEDTDEGTYEEEGVSDDGTPESFTVELSMLTVQTT